MDLSTSARLTFLSIGFTPLSSSCSLMPCSLIKPSLDWSSVGIEKRALIGVFLLCNIRFSEERISYSWSTIYSSDVFIT